MLRPSLASLLVPAVAWCGCAAPQQLDAAVLDRAAKDWSARAAPGRIGVGVMDLDCGEAWYLDPEGRFPLQSVFKAPLAAAVLDRVDAGELSLEQTIAIGAGDLSVYRSPIAEAFAGEPRAFTIRQLIEAAVIESDNTAADVLMRTIGGPGALRSFLMDHDVPEIRVDRYESELQTECGGVGPFDVSMSRREGMEAARARTPPEAQRAAFDAYLADPRDTATPHGAITFLARLAMGDLLSESSTRLLLDIMARAMTGPGRLRAGLPAGTTLAHKTGTSHDLEGRNGATNDIGIATFPNGHRLAIAVFLSGSTLPADRRDALIADVARAAVAANAASAGPYHGAP